MKGIVKKSFFDAAESRVYVDGDVFETDNEAYGEKLISDGFIEVVKAAPKKKKAED